MQAYTAGNIPYLKYTLKVYKHTIQHVRPSRLIAIFIKSYQDLQVYISDKIPDTQDLQVYTEDNTPYSPDLQVYSPGSIPDSIQDDTVYQTIQIYNYTRKTLQIYRYAQHTVHPDLQLYAEDSPDLQVHTLDSIPDDPDLPTICGRLSRFTGIHTRQYTRQPRFTIIREIQIYRYTHLT